MIRNSAQSGKNRTSPRFRSNSAQIPCTGLRCLFFKPQERFKLQLDAWSARKQRVLNFTWNLITSHALSSRFHACLRIVSKSVIEERSKQPLLLVPHCVGNEFRVTGSYRATGKSISELGSMISCIYIIQFLASLSLLPSQAPWQLDRARCASWLPDVKLIYQNMLASLLSEPPCLCISLLAQF